MKLVQGIQRRHHARLDLGPWRTMDAAPQDMMDRLGVALTNRSIYHWTAHLPTDTNGIPVPPNDFNLMEGVAFVRTNFLPEVTAALGNFGKITDTNFVLTLSSNETSMAAVILDFGDIQMLRALLHSVELG